MKQMALILTLALGLALALANPVWTSETIVREGQDLRFGSTAIQAGDASIQNGDGSVISVWTQTRAGENLLLANKQSVEGVSLWSEDLRVKGGEAFKRDIRIAQTGDDGYIVAWLEQLGTGQDQLLVQKFNADGNLLWDPDGLVVNSDCRRDGAKYFLEGFWLGGALLFVQPDVSLPRALGYKFDSQGTETWASNRPAINFEGTLNLQGMLANWGDGDIVVAYQTESLGNGMNCFKRFHSYGSGSWEQSYPKYPGEYGDHQLCLSGDLRIYDMALTALMDTRIKIKLLTWGGDWNIEEPLEVVVNPSPVPLKTRIKGSVWGLPRILCGTIENGVSTLTWYQFYSAGMQVAEQLIRSSSDVLIEAIDDFQDNLGKFYFTWVEESLVDGTRKLKAQLRDNYTGDLVWPQEGLTLSDALDEVSRPRCFAWDEVLLSITAEPGDDAKYLRRRAFSSEGTPLLTPEEEIMAEALSGAAWPVASLDVDDLNFVFFGDSRNASETRLYLQKISPSGELLLPGDGIRLGSGSASVLKDAINHTFQHFAVLYYSDGLYLQIFDLNGNTQWPEPGLLIGEVEPLSARLASWEGDIYVSWVIPLENLRKQVMGQRISDGQALWGTEGISLKNEIYSPQTVVGPPVARYFTWSERTLGPYNHVFGKRLDALGNAEEGWYADGNYLFRKEQIAAFKPSQAAMSGNNLILLIDGEAGKPAFAQKVTSDIQLPWGLYGVELLGDNGTYLAGMADEHGVVIGFKHNDGVYVQAVNADGELIYDAPGNKLDQTGPAEVGGMSLGRFASGHFLAVWSANHLGPAGDLDLYFSRATAWGETLDPYPRLLCGASGDQDVPVLSNPGLECMFVSWKDGRSGYGDHSQLLAGVRAQLLTWSDSAIGSEPQTPAVNSVLSCQPNPFRASTRICWDQKEASPAKIAVYNVRGQLVKRFEPKYAERGEQSLVWNGDDERGRQVSPGIYFIRLQSGPMVQTGKVLRW